MTSMFDQYEKESQKLAPTSLGVSFPTYDDEDPPIFKKSPINFQPEGKVTHMAASNDFIVVALSNNVLLRIDPKKSKAQGGGISEIELNRIVPGVRLSGLFLDPTGDHLLISFATELLYLNRKSNKPKPVSKVRDHEVTAVGWHATAGNPGDSTTKPILLGTSRGQIFETELGSDDGLFPSCKEIYCKQVFDIGQRCAIVITGLEYHRFHKTDKYFVVATTEDRLYQFVGKIPNPDDRPLLQSLFVNYLGVREAFHSLPGSVEYSKLQLYTPQPGATPTALCWLTAAGIYFGQIDVKGTDQILTGAKMFNFPLPEPHPISFLMTDFHILVVYQNHVAGISNLSEQTVFGDCFNESYGKLINIVKDPVKETIWIYAEKAIFKYKVTDEDRHVWQIYADKGDYERAKKYCKNDALKLDKVLKLQADDSFSKKKYEESAEFYAETQCSFEEVAIKFIQVGDEQALKTFLRKKLSRLQDGDKAQRTMLVIWILQLLLTQLADLKTKGKSNTVKYSDIQKELDNFLVENYTKECIKSNKQAVYSLMSSHGDQTNLVRLAKAAKDYDKVVSHYINKGDIKGALEELRDQSNPELWYNHLYALVQEDPKNSLMILRRLGKSLDVTKILPSLVAVYTVHNAEEIIKFLEVCTNELNCQEKAVHNFLLYLLAQYKPDKLKNYLKLQGEEPSMVNYDIRYAVRVCREFNRDEACVQLYTLLGLWEPAVELALQVGMPLARATVQQLHNCSREEVKKLWLKIAQHVIVKENGIKEAMQLVEDVDVIKIEDILPFFPDLTTIDHFKDAICSSLQEYNQHIDDLKEEMEDATKSAQTIRNEINTFRSKYCTIQITDTCYICNTQLLLNPFYSFPCGHRFHMNCLVTELTPLLPPINRESLQSLLRKDESNLTAAQRDKVRSDLDAILASQCLYCGDLMIEMIDKPFIEEEDYERIRKEWE